MRFPAIVFLGAALVSVALCASPQRDSHPYPYSMRQIEKMPDPMATVPPAPAVQPKVSFAQLNKEAQQLADLASSVPAEIQQVEKGALPKDLKPRLEKVEKLSKELRRQLKL